MPRASQLVVCPYRALLQIVFSAALLSVSTPVIATSVDWDIDHSPLCGDVLNEVECATVIESALLGTHSKVARRVGDTLVVVGQDSILILIDQMVHGTEYMLAPLSRFLHHYDELGLALVYQAMENDARLVLLDLDDLTMHEVRAVPYVSPDARSFTVTTDFTMDHNFIEIWDAGSMQKIWSRGMSDWRTLSTRWIGSDTVEVVLAPILDGEDRATEDNLPSMATVRVTRSDSAWVIDPRGTWDAVPRTIMVR